MNAELIVNEDYLAALTLLLNHARRQVDILAFSFAIGTGGGGAPRAIADRLIALKKKHKTKMVIRLYLEGARDTADRNRVTGRLLAKHGIQVRFGATHAKGFSIDGRYVLFGSTNLTNQSIMKNNETNLLFDDPAVAEGFSAYFEHLWQGGQQGEIEVEPPLIADGGFKDVLVEMIDGARKRLDFSIYFFDHPEIERAFVRAHRRGVKIHGFLHNHATFALSYVRRTRATAERLRQAGITDLHFGPTHLFTHSKYLIRDQREIALGTGNWLPEDVSTHPQLYVRFTDAKLAKKFPRRLRN